MALFCAINWAIIVCLNRKLPVRQCCGGGGGDDDDDDNNNNRV
jgi:hypothetical protein